MMALHGQDEFETTFLGEDFELGVLENAYRSGTMPRLTGVSSGAPVGGDASFPSDFNGRAGVTVGGVPAGAAEIAGGGSEMFTEGLGFGMHENGSLPIDSGSGGGVRLPVDTRDHKRAIFDDDSQKQFEDGNLTTASKRSRDSFDNDDEHSLTNSGSKVAKVGKDTNKSHTRKCREKVNDKFRQLLEELPKPPDGIEVQHKAQILDYTIETLKELANKKTSLETELAFSSKKNLLRWVDNVISNAKTFPDAVKPFLDMFCTKKGWKYAELWLPIRNALDGKPRESDMLLQLKRWVLNRSLGGEEKDNLLKFAERSENFTFNPRVGVPGRVFSTLRPEWLPQLDNNETFVRAAEASEFGLNVCLAVPVVIRGQVAAVTVFFDTEVRDYDADCLDLAIDIASLTGNAYGAQTARH